MKTTKDRLQTLKTRREKMLLQFDTQRKALREKARNERQIKVTTTHKFHELPRGVLTKALVDALGDSALPVPLVIEKVAPKFKKVTGITHKIRCLLSISPRFTRVSRGVYKTSGELTGHLFERLDKEVVLV